MINLENILLPKHLKNKFELIELEEKKNEWIAHFVEKEDLIPNAAKHRTFGNKIVKNGFMRTVEVVDFPLKKKLCYFHFKRRRWKIEGTKESFHNKYKFHPKGQKCTFEFRDFLKYLGRRARHKFFLTWENIRLIREEDFSLVSRIKRFFKNQTEER